MLPDDVANWKPADYKLARRYNHPKLLDAIVRLGGKISRIVKVAKCLVDLLKPLPAEKSSDASPAGAPATPAMPFGPSSNRAAPASDARGFARRSSVDSSAGPAPPPPARRATGRGPTLPPFIWRSWSRRLSRRWAAMTSPCRVARWRRSSAALSPPTTTRRRWKRR